MLGDIVFTAPMAYQAVDVAYALADGHCGFKAGEYDKNWELVIDPLLASTYKGGISDAFVGVLDAAGDGSGSAGLTSSDVRCLKIQVSDYRARYSASSSSESVSLTGLPFMLLAFFDFSTTV